MRKNNKRMMNNRLYWKGEISSDYMTVLRTLLMRKLNMKRIRRMGTLIRQMSILV